MQKVRTIFIGTAEFGLPTLKALLELDYINLCGVITQPDKPAGRNQALKASIVKEWLEKECEYVNDTWVLKQKSSENKNVATRSGGLEQPIKLKETSKEILEKYKPDLIIVAAYGQIIPDDMLDYPRYKCLNLHGSVLPSLRGAVPVHMAILQGHKTTGVSLQRMVSRMDAGAVIKSIELKIENKDTTETLMAKLSNIAKDIVCEDLLKWIEGKLSETPQEESMATYCYMSDIAKEKAEITYDTPIDIAERMIRAFYPWPVVWVRLNDGTLLKIYKAKKFSDGNSASNKESKIRIYREAKNLMMELKNGVLLLEEIQLEGKKRMKASEYLFLAS